MSATSIHSDNQLFSKSHSKLEWMFKDHQTIGGSLYHDNQSQDKTNRVEMAGGGWGAQEAVTVQGAEENSKKAIISLYP